MYGFIPLILCFIGIIYLLNKGNKYIYCLLLGLVLLFKVMLAFARFEVGMDTICVRGVSTVLLHIGIATGTSLYWLRTKAFSFIALNECKFRSAVVCGSLW